MLCLNGLESYALQLDAKLDIPAGGSLNEGKVNEGKVNEGKGE